MPMNESLRIFILLLEAFGYAHSLGVIHRDIKPNNIMINAQGQPIILDFGIAKLLGSDLTQYSQTMGTPVYMSPEQITSPRNIDHRSDIYTLGIVLYELLAGVVPYKSLDSHYSLMREIVEVNIPSVSAFRSDIPSALNSIISKATAKERDNRYSDCQSFKTALLAALYQGQEAQREAERKKREAAALQEAQQKQREAAALQEAERKRREEAARQEAERKRREEAAQQDAERKRQEELLRKSPFTAHINGVPFDMVFVQGGTFQMGSNDGSDREKPVHAVKLADFHIGKYPVTQAQWRAVMGNNPSHFSGCDNCPVEFVNWDYLQRFIAKLNELSKAQGQQGRYFLPTEAQWEYAARGGQLSKGYAYSGSNNLDEVGWYEDNSGDKTHVVGAKKANELGLYDMSGNVLEWCSDWYGGRYSSGLQENPIGAATGTLRVLRGGSWLYDAQDCRPASRHYGTPTHSYYNLGCRLGWFPL
jgi:formylglycine-generating enzyme required for sulfatase activity